MPIVHILSPGYLSQVFAARDCGSDRVVSRDPQGLTRRIYCASLSPYLGHLAVLDSMEALYRTSILQADELKSETYTQNRDVVIEQAWYETYVLAITGVSWAWADHDEVESLHETPYLRPLKLIVTDNDNLRCRNDIQDELMDVVCVGVIRVHEKALAHPRVAKSVDISLVAAPPSLAHGSRRRRRTTAYSLQD